MVSLEVGLSVLGGSPDGGPGGALALRPRLSRLSYLLRSLWKYWVIDAGGSKFSGANFDILIPGSSGSDQSSIFGLIMIGLV